MNSLPCSLDSRAGYSIVYKYRTVVENNISTMCLNYD